MKLTVTPLAAKKLAAAQEPHTKALLSFDDGVGPSSKYATCALKIAFQVVLVDDSIDLSDYQAELATNMGTWYYKDYSKTYLAENMKLSVDPRYQTLVLSGESGQIDSQVQLIDARHVDKTVGQLI